ncbi:PIF1-like helicase-domain-containing protein, partial [Mycena epipterygia]
VLACIDEFLRRLMGNNLPFGGKVLILLGDFRQTCPVIRRGTRAQVVDASVKFSPLFQHFTVLRLKSRVPHRNRIRLRPYKKRP